MKRIIILLLLICMLCACSQTSLSTEETMLRSGKWISFSKDSCSVSFHDGYFSSCCNCGSHLAQIAQAEAYHYDTKTRIISILNSDEKVLQTAQIIYVDNYYLVINSENQTYVYENQNAIHPKALTDAPTACLTVLSMQDGMIEVSDCSYDKDAADNFRTDFLLISQNLSIHRTDIIIQNGGIISSNSNKIAISELEHYLYSNAYLHFDEHGFVDRIDFFGQTIIS